MKEARKLKTEDNVNTELITAGFDSEGHFIYPFLDCDDLDADMPAGKWLLDNEIEIFVETTCQNRR